MDKNDGKMVIEDYRELWEQAPGPVFWCEKYQHPLHRVHTIELHYELLPQKALEAMGKEGLEHEGKTGDHVKATADECYGCPKNIINGGNCDPV